MIAAKNYEGLLSAEEDFRVLFGRCQLRQKAYSIDSSSSCTWWLIACP